MIDIDSAPYCWWCNEILALVETALDTGLPKATTVMRLHARRSGIPAYLVLYRVDEHDAIISFRVRQVAPTFGPESVMTPEEWAVACQQIHERHLDVCSGGMRPAVSAEMQRRLV